MNALPLYRACALGLLLMAAGGCASRESGYRISEETVAFIQPGVTSRAELLENLGPPLLELKDPRVVAYSWGKLHATGGKPVPPPESIEARQMGYTPLEEPADGPNLVESKRWVCCIALDANDRVTRFETIQLAGAPSLEAAVRRWATKP